MAEIRCLLHNDSGFRCICLGFRESSRGRERGRGDKKGMKEKPEKEIKKNCDS